MARDFPIFFNLKKKKFQLFTGAILNSKCLYRSFASTMIGVLMYDIVLVIIFGLDIGISTVGHC